MNIWFTWKSVCECLQQSYSWLPQTGNNPNVLPQVHEWTGCGTVVRWNTTLGHGQSWCTNMCNHLNESQRHCAEWQEPDSEGYPLSESPYMTLRKGEDYREGEQICSCQGLRLGEGLTTQGQHRGILGGAWTSLYLVHVLVLWRWLHNTTHLSKLAKLCITNNKSAFFSL